MKCKTSQTPRSYRLPVIFAALAALAGGMAAAEETASPYRMAVFVDGAYGEELAAGEFERAIDRLDADAPRFFASNNLCVAYIMASDAANAREACEAAVEKSEKRIRHAEDWNRPAYKRDHAIALTNRGVVLAVSGDLSGARGDFERALSLHSRLEEPEVNLNRLRAALAAAQ